MLQQLEHIDRTLFLFFNGLHSPFFDTIMPWLSGNIIWMPFYVGLLYLLHQKNTKKKFYSILFTIGCCILVTDQVSVHLFKNIVERYRPCHNTELKNIVHLVKHCGGWYGFVSSHAANVFGIATLLSFLFKQKKIVVSLLFWAVLVSYTRVYLGVHYPADIFCGAILGLFVGYLFYRIFTKLLSYD